MVCHHLSFTPTATESLKHNQKDQDYESQVLHIQVVSAPFPKLQAIATIGLLVTLPKKTTPLFINGFNHPFR